MDFVQHSFAWAEGEVFEATLTAAVGVFTVATGLLFWRFGETPNAKALLIPLVLVGLLFTAAGASGVVSNKARVHAFQQAGDADPSGFVDAEQARVEGFGPLFTFTLILAPVCFAGATALFYLSESPHARATAIALVIVGLGGLVIDYFAKERADTYYAHILAEQARRAGPGG